MVRLLLRFLCGTVRLRGRSGHAPFQTDVVTDALRFPDREWRGFVLSDLLRNQRTPTPVTTADLSGLGVSVETIRQLAAFAPYPAEALRDRSVLQPSAYHVKSSEVIDATS